MLVGTQDYALIIHNFVKHRENKKWVPIWNGVPRCVQYHCTGHCWENCEFGHEELNPAEEQGMYILVQKYKALKMENANARQPRGGKRDRD